MPGWVAQDTKDIGVGEKSIDISEFSQGPCLGEEAKWILLAEQRVHQGRQQKHNWSEKGREMSQ